MKRDNRTPQERVWEWEAEQAVEQALAEMKRTRTRTGRYTPDELSWVVENAIARTSPAAQEHIAKVVLIAYIKKLRSKKKPAGRYHRSKIPNRRSGRR